jgi:hypothetical protein
MLFIEKTITTTFHTLTSFYLPENLLLNSTATAMTSTYNSRQLCHLYPIRQHYLYLQHYLYRPSKPREPKNGESPAKQGFKGGFGQKSTTNFE